MPERKEVTDPAWLNQLQTKVHTLVPVLRWYQLYVSMIQKQYFKKKLDRGLLSRRIILTCHILQRIIRIRPDGKKERKVDF